MLGLSLAAKTGLVILLPFILVYLIKERVGVFRALEYLLIATALYFFINAPYLHSMSFWQMILHGGQSFVSTLTFQFGEVVVYAMPLVYFGLLVHSLMFKRLNREIFIMFLAFALGIVSLTVVPEAGWYAWILPFFMYLYIKERRAGVLPFIILNIFFFGYFFIASDFLS